MLIVQLLLLIIVKKLVFTRTWLMPSFTEISVGRIALKDCLMIMSIFAIRIYIERDIKQQQEGYAHRPYQNGNAP